MSVPKKKKIPQEHEAEDIPLLVPNIVPVTILTGFLGAGKTTLLQYILNADLSLRIAVVLNEFSGATAFEKGLSIRSSRMDNEEWLEMPNGCLCCTMKDRAVEAIETLVASRPIDHVLVETSGVSDPAPIAALFWKDNALSSSLKLNGVIAVVDTSRVNLYLHGSWNVPEALRQILLADVILLNKIDLIDTEARLSIEEQIRQLNPNARMEYTSYARTNNIQQLLYINSLESSLQINHTKLKSLHFSKACKVTKEKGENIPVESQFSSTPHLQPNFISHVFVTFSCSMPSKRALDDFACRLLWNSDTPRIYSSSSTTQTVEGKEVEVIRAKGLFTVCSRMSSKYLDSTELGSRKPNSEVSTTEKFIFEAVGKVYDFFSSFDNQKKRDLFRQKEESGHADLTSDENYCSILVLGREITEEFVRSCFDGAMSVTL